MTKFNRAGGRKSAVKSELAGCFKQGYEVEHRAYGELMPTGTGIMPSMMHGKANGATGNFGAVNGVGLQQKGGLSLQGGMVGPGGANFIENGGGGSDGGSCNANNGGSGGGNGGYLHDLSAEQKLKLNIQQLHIRQKQLQLTDYDDNSLSSEEHVLAPAAGCMASPNRPCLTWACKACKKKSVAVDRRKAATLRERRRLRKVSVTVPRRGTRLHLPPRQTTEKLRCLRKTCFYWNVAPFNGIKWIMFWKKGFGETNRLTQLRIFP
uniref:Myogenic muscle-specific protein N-terminal domain-containing protein n=1 Tax=Anopheles melas TaxID=34690 RepID=A0A182TG85_9DIPT